MRAGLACGLSHAFISLPSLLISPLHFILLVRPSNVLPVSDKVSMRQPVSSHHIPASKISIRSNRPQGILLSGAFICCSVILLAYNTSEWLPLLVLLCFFYAACLCMIYCLNQNSYGPMTDVLGDGKWMRGCTNEPVSQDDVDNIVKTLYQFCGYDRIKTSWPCVLFFSFLASLALGSVITSSTSWVMSVFVCFTTLVLAYAYISGFLRVHGDEQAQMFIDSLYMRYKAARAYQMGKEAGLRSGAPTS